MEKSRAIVAIVENDAATLRALERLLRAGGYHAEGYASAESFLARGSREVGCLLLDIDLDGMSGLELQHQLRSANAAPPVIFLTGKTDDASRARARSLGCLAFLQKPFSAAELMHVLDEALAGPA